MISPTVSVRSNLSSLLEHGAPAIDIAAYLHALEPAKRVQAALALRGRQLRRLYEAVAGADSLTLADVVPPTTPLGASITFEGRNSLPAFSRFQKRFTRTDDGVVFGYNRQPLWVTQALTGPGYFLVAEADDGEHAGELLFDYTKAPPFEPGGWPMYRTNAAGLSRWVFMHMHDYVRRVADGVLIGAAFKLGVAQDAYFVLARE